MTDVGTYLPSQIINNALQVIQMFRLKVSLSGCPNTRMHNSDDINTELYNRSYVPALKVCLCANNDHLVFFTVQVTSAVESTIVMNFKHKLY